MSEKYDRAFESLDASQFPSSKEYQDQLRKVQEDMSEGLREAVAGGWMTQDEADQHEYEWIQTFGCQ